MNKSYVSNLHCKHSFVFHTAFCFDQRLIAGGCSACNSLFRAQASHKCWRSCLSSPGPVISLVIYHYEFSNKQKCKDYWTLCFVPTPVASQTLGSRVWFLLMVWMFVLVFWFVLLRWSGHLYRGATLCYQWFIKPQETQAEEETRMLSQSCQFLRHFAISRFKSSVCLSPTPQPIHMSPSLFLKKIPLYVSENSTGVTGRRGRVVSTPASYSGGPGFKSRPGDRLYWLRFFVVFLSPSRKMPG
jgi:hypothetical protein